MYKVILINNNVETIIHFPNSDKEVPHLNKLQVLEGLSNNNSLSFSLYQNNEGYTNVFELTTKVKVVDIRDNSIRFVGRVIKSNENMDNSGLFYKEVSCEGALSFLVDTKQRTKIFDNASIIDFISEILEIHNSKVDSSKQVQLGNIDVVGQVSHSCNFETTLDTILAEKNKLGGEIRVRENNGILYLDWLQSFSTNTVDIKLGENMKDMVKGKDVTSLGTRIIPLGANNLTISSVNDGIDYIEDSVAVSVYGVIEKTVEYKDITNATELYNICLADINNYTQPLFLLETNALDLSFLSGNKAKQFVLGTDLYIVNPVMGVDSNYKVVQIDVDLLQAYNPNLTIANFPAKLNTSINDLKKSSIQKESVNNGVQIGDNFGIRVVRDDGKVIILVNANEGISIENESKKVFSVDIDGNIIAEDGTYKNIKVVDGIIEVTKEDKSATIKIDPNGGISIENSTGRVFYLSTEGKVICEGGTFNDMQAFDATISGLSVGDVTIIGDVVNFESGASIDFTGGQARLRASGTDYISVSNGLNVYLYGGIVFYADNTGAYSQGNKLATQAWVTDNFAPKATDPPPEE